MADNSPLCVLCVCVYHIVYSGFTKVALHIWAIINNAAVYIGMHASFQMNVFLQIYAPEEASQDCWVVWQLNFLFEEPPYCVPEGPHTDSYSHQQCAGGSLFSAVSPPLIISVLTFNRYSSAEAASL